MGAQSNRIGEHRILEKLDGYGREVYLTRRKDGSRALVALFDVNDKTAESLEETSARCLALNVPHLSCVVELFDHADQRAVVFEDIRGISLSKINKVLRKHGATLTNGALLEICRCVCLALHAAHMAKGEGGRVVPLVHHQLGPHQVFVTLDGEVRLLGMGLGPIFELLVDPAKFPWEGYAYAAPEVVQGKMVTARANTFSAAAILWAGLTGFDPPDGRFPKVAQLLPELPEQLARSIDTALEPVAIRRTVTCGQLADALDKSGIPSREELLANIEVLSRDSEIGGTYPLESLPPTSGPDASDSAKTNVYEVTTPRVGIPDPIGEEHDDETVTLDTGEGVASDPQTPKKRRKRPPMDSVTRPSLGVVPHKSKPPSSPKVKVEEARSRGQTRIPAPPRALQSEREKRSAPPSPLPESESAPPPPPSQPEDEPYVDEQPVEEEPTSSGASKDVDVERLKHSREKLAKRETMRLATSLRDQLKKPPGLAKTRRPARTPPPEPHDSGETAVLPIDPDERETSQDADDVSTPRRKKPKLPTTTQEISEDVVAGTPPDGRSREKTKVPATTQEIPQEALDALAAEERRRFPVKTRELPPPPDEEVVVEIPPQTPTREIAPSMRVADGGAAEAKASSEPSEPPPERASPHPVMLENPPSVRASPSLRVIAEPASERIVVVAPQQGPKLWNVVTLVALVGIACIAAGLAVGRFTAEPSARSPEQVSAAPQPTQAPSAPKPAASPVAVSASPSASGPPKPLVTPTEHTTVLIVDTTVEESYVYLGGKPVGPPTGPMAVPCGVRNIRLGTFPLSSWLSEGKPFNLPCGGTLEITLEPYYAGPRMRR